MMMLITCMDGQCVKKLPVGSFKWVDDLSIFTEDFIKNYDEKSDIGYLFVVDVECPKYLQCYIVIYPFYLRE